MRNIFFITYLFAAVLALGSSRKDIKVDTTSIGNSTTTTKTIELNTAQGASNARITANASADLTLVSPKVKVGTGASVDQTLAFDRGAGSANPNLKWDEARGKIQFSNDGTSYKDIGSGAGSSGFNLLDNADFEAGISTGWGNIGGSVSPVTAGSNLIEGAVTASFDASADDDFFQSSAYAVPVFLHKKQCMARVDYRGGDSNLFMTVVDGSNTDLIPAANHLTFSAYSDDGSKTAKLYFDCPTSGAIKLRIEAIANAAAIYLDKTYLGESDSKPVSSSGPWISYTSGCTGSWSANTTYVCRKRRTRDSYEYDIQVQLSGAPDATTLTLNLPDTIDTNKLASGSSTGFESNIQGKTNIYRGSSYTGGVNLTTATSVTLTYFDGNGNGSNINYAAPAAFTSGDKVGVVFAVPIVGIGSSEDTINSKCPTDIACENVFTARIDSGGGVLSENLDWISGSCPVTSTNRFTCTFNAGIFTATPTCTVTTTATSGATNITAGISASSSSSVLVDTKSGTSDSAQPFNIQCQKSGSDFKPRQNIQGFLNTTVTSGSDYVRLEAAFVNGICSASPCTVTDKTTGINTITRSGTGIYSVNFVAGAFSKILHCDAHAQSAGGNPTYSSSDSDPALTTSAFKFRLLRKDTHAEVDEKFSVSCIGLR